MSEEFRTTSVLIQLCADQFPAVFTLHRWKPYLPLAIGIDKALIATGILKPFEVGLLLNAYCRRRMYQQALAAGGPRYNLDGTVDGEVTNDQSAFAKVRLARIDERAAEAAAKVRAEWRAARAAEKARTKAERDADPTRVASRTDCTAGPAVAVTLPSLEEGALDRPYPPQRPPQRQRRPPRRPRIRRCVSVLKAYGRQPKRGAQCRRTRSREPKGRKS
jgi:sRNA-binding protein